MGTGSSKDNDGNNQENPTATVCWSCRQELGDEYVSALERNFHKHHFVCKVCACPLADQEFFGVDGEPYCATHYAEEIAKKCHRCAQPIVQGRVFSAVGRDFHEACFQCARCSTVLKETDQFYTELDANDTRRNSKKSKSKKTNEEDNDNDEKKQNPRLIIYCRVCHVSDPKYEGDSPLCGWCEEPVESDGVITAENSWHKECFVCVECHKSLLNQEFWVDRDRRVFCRDPTCVFDREQKGKKRKRSWFDFLPFRSVKAKHDENETQADDEADDDADVDVGDNAASSAAVVDTD